MVCGEYCCLFALYMDRGYTRIQLVRLFTPDIAHQQVEQLFQTELGSLRWVLRGGLCCTHRYKRRVPPLSYLIYNPNVEQNGSCSCYRFINLVWGTRRRNDQGRFRGGRICPRNISFPTPIHQGAPWFNFFRN